MKSNAKKDLIDDITERNQPPGSTEQIEQIATAAYFKAETRGFAPGRELDDWLAAEVECDDREQDSQYS